MNFTPEFESTVEHTVQGLLCVMPLIPLFLYVVVFSYMTLSPLVVPIVKWRPQRRARVVGLESVRLQRPVTV